MAAETAFTRVNAMLGRLAPKKYGDRLAAEVSGPDAGPIETASGIPPGVLASMEVIRRRIAEVSAVTAVRPVPRHRQRCVQGVAP